MVDEKTHALSIGDAKAGMTPLVIPIDGDARPGWLAHVLLAVAVQVFEFEDL